MLPVNSHSGGTQGYTSLSFQLFLIGVIFVYLDFARFAFDHTGIVFSKPIRILSILGGPLFLFLSILVALREGALRRIRALYKWWLLSLIFTFALLLMTGVLAFENEIRRVGLDFILLPAIFAGILIGSKKENWIFIDKFIMAFFTINVFLCFYWIGKFTGYLLESRSMIVSAFNQTPYTFWGTLYIWPYFIITITDKSVFRKIVTIMGIVLFFSFSIIFLKRMPFIHLILFIFLVFSKIKIRHGVKPTILLLAGTMVVWQSFLLISGEHSQILTEKLRNRFIQRSSVEGLKTSIRFGYDPFLVLTQFSGMEFVIGRGMGGTVKDVEGFYPEEMIQSLHNGSARVMLKGGVILLIIWTGGWLFVFRDFIVNRNYTLNRYFIPILLVFLLSWIDGFLARTVTFIFLMMCAGRVMSRDIEDFGNRRIKYDQRKIKTFKE